jgi:hypothetical protein
MKERVIEIRVLCADETDEFDLVEDIKEYLQPDKRVLTILESRCVPYTGNGLWADDHSQRG